MLELTPAAGLAAALILAGSVVAAAVIVRLRRAGLAVHSQLDQIREDISNVRHNAQVQTAAMQEALRQAGDRITQNREGLEEVRAQLQSLTHELAKLTTTLGDTADMVMRRPPRALPIEPRILEADDEKALIEWAESIAILRPLVPYPRWRTDMDWNNPDMSFQLRRWVWQLCKDRRRDAAVVVPWHYGTRLRLFLGNDVSGQIYVSGCLEPNEFAFLDRILEPGMTFVDAGANDGIYAVFAAKRLGPGGRVIAFEPSQREVERLRYNVQLNGLDVRIHAQALADRQGKAELTIGGQEHAGHNTLGALAHGGFAIAAKEMVEVRRLDDVFASDSPDRVDVIKLDVEGAEIRALRGAARTLQQYRPILLFEVSEESLRHQGGTREELLDFVRSQDYRLYLFDRMSGLPVPAEPGAFSDNMLGIPAQKQLPEVARSPWPLRAE